MRALGGTQMATDLNSPIGILIVIVLILAIIYLLRRA